MIKAIRKRDIMELDKSEEEFRHFSEGAFFYELRGRRRTARRHPSVQ